MTLLPDTWHPLPETVEQCDRDTAAEIVRCCAPNMGLIASDIKGGVRDNNYVVKLIVANRLAFCRAVLVRAGRIRENDDD